MTSSQTLLNNGSYTYAYFFRILSTIKTKFGRILVCCMNQFQKSVAFSNKPKTFFPNNFLKISLEQLKLSDHIELEKRNTFAFSNLYFQQQRWLNLKKRTLFSVWLEKGSKFKDFS